MRTTAPVSAVVVAVAMLLAADAGHALPVCFGLNGGISKARGEGSEYWELGFAGGGHAFLRMSPNVWIGGRAAYNRWTPDEEELTSGYGVAGVDFDISGEATVIELVPSVRVVLPGTRAQGLNFFAQAGAGWYQMDFEATVKASFLKTTVEETVEFSDEEWGVNFGGGLMFGGTGLCFEIFPLYNIIFTEDESTEYFSVNAGFLIGY